MTPLAIRQFIAICGGDCIAKGATVSNPQVKRSPPDAYLMGQSDYLALSLTYGTSRAGWEIPCPFEKGSTEAALWAAGKLNERKLEQRVVEAYAVAERRSA